MTKTKGGKDKESTSKWNSILKGERNKTIRPT